MIMLADDTYIYIYCVAIFVDCPKMYPIYNIKCYLIFNSILRAFIMITYIILYVAIIFPE